MAELLGNVELISIERTAHYGDDLRTENLAFSALAYLDRAERAEARCRKLEADQNHIMDEWGNMAHEWDRYWRAAGVGDGSISVDDAIACWQALESRVQELAAKLRKQQAEK